MQTIRTMIVDDEARIRRGIERLVTSCGEGWEIVATASDGREALDYFESSDGAVDLLITDVKMPEMDGLTLIKEAKKRYSFYPLLISGYDDFSYLQAALREGALDYLLKPVDREQFRVRMSEIRLIIANGKYQSLKKGEMEREAEKLKKTRQTQALSYITSMGIDMTSLGYWVDEFPSGAYLLFSVRFGALPVKARAYKPNDWKAFYFALDNILGELLDNQIGNSNRRGWSWRGGETEYWLLLHGPDPDYDWETSAYELANRIRSAIQTYTPFSVSVAYGDLIEDLYLLPEAGRQASTLMNYRFLHGGNRIFRPSGEMEEEKVSTSDDKELTQTVQKMKRGVEQGNAEESAEYAKQFFQLLDRLESPERLRKAVQNAMILIHSAALESRGGIANSTSIEDELRKAEKATDLHELKRCVKQLMDRVIGLIQAARESNNMKPVEQAKSWIKLNAGQEVTIKKIADQVFMNPTYFSELFKLQTGETVLDYLTRERMAMAQELLAVPRLKLQEICERVGYQDVKYFSRLFKQWTGQTPSKFRERYIVQRGDDTHAEERQQ
ncbi:response regulator transcription factor [Cohnella lupini]|uniref:Two-component system response regulator YesN n=1 Tax=Cohnella lupini TaxID=1294267 RepID=A0A3D9IST0_9BACL|nr:helix-turn-helix domain-containing protein [Cohnella lupini]RED64768.1 two-component system response regulator YesN [Cohnella lupini]